jgi:hypothetical protein
VDIAVWSLEVVFLLIMAVAIIGMLIDRPNP